MEVGSRNLLRVAKLDKTTTFLRSTAPEVVKALEELPGTKHDVTGTGGATEGTGGTVIGSAAAGKFVVDAFTCLGVLPGEGDAGIVLFVNVHGEFAERECLEVWPQLDLTVRQNQPVACVRLIACLCWPLLRLIRRRM